MNPPSKLDMVSPQSNLEGFVSRSLLLFLGGTCHDPCSKGCSCGSALLDTCLTAESLLENDERFEDAIEFFVHNLVGSLHLIKGEGMGRHERGIDALHLQHAQQAFHAQTATRTQAGRNGLFRHADLCFVVSACLRTPTCVYRLREDITFRGEISSPVSHWGSILLFAHIHVTGSLCFVTVGSHCVADNVKS